MREGWREKEEEREREREKEREREREQEPMPLTQSGVAQNFSHVPFISATMFISAL